MPSLISEIREEALRELEQVRMRNQEIQEKTIAQIYANIPRIREIDQELDGLALDSCKDILKGGAAAEQVVESMRTRTKALTEERAALLHSHGVPPDCTGPVYNCKLCKDKGYVDNHWCACFEKRVRSLLQQRAHICADAGHDFAHFDLTLFSDRTDPKRGLSPRENAQSNYERALSFAKGRPDAAEHLLFYGETGLGKTFTSDCVAKEFLQAGRTVFYTSAPRLFSIFEDYRFGRSTSEESRYAIDAAAACDLLIIDDLGTEFRTSYVDSILFDIINSRINEHRHMIISTNLTPEQLGDTYSMRIYSRIEGHFEKVLFFGDDLRLKKEV